MTPIIKIENIGEVYSATLHETSINTVEALLDKCATPQGWQALPETTEIIETYIL